MGQLDRSRRELYEGSDQLFAVVPVRFFTFLSHGRAGRVQSERRADGELLAGQRDAADRGVQQFQGPIVWRGADAAQESQLDGQLLSGAGASGRDLLSLHESSQFADAAGRILPADYSRA